MPFAVFHPLTQSPNPDPSPDNKYNREKEMSLPSPACRINRSLSHNFHLISIHLDRSQPALVLDRDDNSHDDKEDDQYQETHQFYVLPPHLSLQASASNSEFSCAAPQSVSLVDQKIQALSSLQQALNVLRHNASNIVNLPLRISNGIVSSVACRSIVDHELL